MNANRVTLWRAVVRTIPLWWVCMAGCVKPDTQSTLDVKSAVATLETNNGQWTPAVTSAISAALNDQDYRIKARGLVAVTGFPKSCPASVRELVKQLAHSDPDTPGIQEALQALGSE